MVTERRRRIEASRRRRQETREHSRAAREARRDIDSVTQSTRRLGRTTLGVLPGFGSGALLAGLFGGSLLNLALSGGAAANSMIRLQSTFEDLFNAALTPFLPLLDRFFELDERIQGAILVGGALAALFRGPLIRAISALRPAMLLAFATNPITLAIGAAILFGATLFVLYRRFEPFRDVVNGAFDAIGERFRLSLAAVRLLRGDIDALLNLLKVDINIPWLDSLIEKLGIAANLIPDVTPLLTQPEGRQETGGAIANTLLPRLPIIGGLFRAQDLLNTRAAIDERPDLSGLSGVGAGAAQVPNLSPTTWIINQFFGVNQAAVEDTARATQNDAATRARDNGGF